MEDILKPKNPMARNVLVFPDIMGRDLEIDEEDYGVIKELLSMDGVRDDFPTRLLECIMIEEVTKRVQKLCCYYVFPNTTSLTASIGRLDTLQELIIGIHNLSSLPDEIWDLQSLTKLELFFSMKLTSLPASIGRLKNLQELIIKLPNLSCLPDEVGDLQSLKRFELHDSKLLISLPASIGRLKNLEELYLCDNSNLKSLPEEIGDLQSLKTLHLWGNELSLLPTSIGGLANLEELDISANGDLSSIPEGIGGLQNLKKLILSQETVTRLPRQFWFRILSKRAKICTARVLASVMKNEDIAILKLLPHLIRNADRAFDDRWISCYGLEKLKVEKPDAIYQILKDCKGYFAHHVL